ncbi:hypothetical protein C9374_006899 [Naegleria lovaniensis]|uniref:Uncharacterized protein n=1 Tax=Naegleria lovaniensis TaxID=51637 RepID=A0AA88KPP1_NAELO|nr:uncharacterized protein C9374_006899 [Naegleria lovaniensis]KAG2393368.1 hypothetical protein C9374_006899 [Naegleria lovaniensis]
MMQPAFLLSCLLFLVLVSNLSTSRAASSSLVRSIQLDVEPYTLSEWTQNQTQTADYYLDMIDKLKQLKSPIPLRFAIPRWFDGISHTRNGVTKKLSEFVQDRGNLMIMDYVNSGTRAVRDASTEIQYALKSGTRVVVGIETMELPSEPTATYFGKSFQELENDLNFIENTFNGNASYEGVAVHDYKWYKNFTQNFTQPFSSVKRDLYVWDSDVILKESARQEFLLTCPSLRES